jgi:hypothetical protein
MPITATELDFDKFVPNLDEVNRFIEQSIWEENPPDQDLNEEGSYYYIGDMHDIIAVYLHNKYPNAFFTIIAACPVVSPRVWKNTDIDGVRCVNDEFFKLAKAGSEFSSMFGT